MDKLQNLAQRFEGFVANFFPDFSKIAVSSLSGLVDIKEAMEKNRPIIRLTISTCIAWLTNSTSSTLRRSRVASGR